LLELAKKPQTNSSSVATRLISTTFYSSPDRNGNPELKKLFFLARTERPKEAPVMAKEKKLFEGGVVMECWK
jgi:hypothetical protein